MTNEILSDELLTTEAIYPNHISLLEGSASTYVITIPDTPITFYLSIDETYPVEGSTKLSSVDGVDKDIVQVLITEASGDEIFFPLLSGLHEYIEDISCREGEDAERLQNDRLEPILESVSVDWSISETLQDRKSTFIGRACRVGSDHDVQAALASIEAKRATHPKIWACRYRDRQTGRITQQGDDDGETAASGRLAFLLDVTKAEDVLVVVSRWFGGVLLGDVRFRHISTVARDALEAGGFLPNASNKPHQKAKR